MAFDRDNLPRLRFSPNPLKVVAAEVRYAPEFKLGVAETLAGLADDFEKQYPIPSRPQPETLFQVSVQAGPGAAPSPQQPPLGPVRFMSEAGDWIVTVGVESFSLETTAYDSWEDFRERWCEVMASVGSRVTLRQVTRMGLRYVDELSFPDAKTIGDWPRYIRPEILGASATDLIGGRTVRSLQQLLLAVDDDAIKVTHGFGRDVQGRASTSTYVIDTDLFTTTASDRLDSDAVLARMDRYHRWAWNLFCGSLTQAAIDALGGGAEA